MFANRVESGRGVTFHSLPIVFRALGSTIRLGDGVVLCSNSESTALGVNYPVLLRTLVPSAEIDIGNEVGMSGASVCAMTRVSIGKETMPGANVMIVDTDFHSLDPGNRRRSQVGIGSRRFVIGRNVFIGGNAIVLKGVTIGENSVVGAGSVTSDIHADVIAAGNPCRALRSLPNVDMEPVH